jgi:hypothetical protein
MALIKCPDCGREVSDRAPTCPQCGAPIRPAARQPVIQPQVIQAPPQKQPKQIGCLGSGCVILIVLFVIVWIAAESISPNHPAPVASGSSSSPAPSPSNESREEQALRNVHITKFSWEKGGFDNVMIANFTIRNDNDFPVKDIGIKCTHEGKSGTEIDSNSRTIYEVIKPKSKKSFHDFNMGLIHQQAARSGCQVVTLAIP